MRPLVGLDGAPVLALLMGAPLNLPTVPCELFAAGGFALLGGIVAMLGTGSRSRAGRSGLRGAGTRGAGTAVVVLLLGGSDEDNLFNHPELPPNGLEAHLDRLQSVGGNYVRNTMSSRDEGNVFPFQGVVREGLYDLTLWNPEYWERFERFERFLEMTLARDIIVQIELWDRFDFAGGGRWAASPYNPRNNVNYTPETSGLPVVVNSPAPERENPFLRTTPGLDDNQEVLQYQRTFVEKVLSISLHYPHVLYTISNETDESPLWSGYWADLILETAEELGQPAYVTEMWAARDPEDPLYDHTYDHPERYAYVEISQNNHQIAQTHWAYAMEHRSPLPPRKRRGLRARRDRVPVRRLLPR